MQQQMAGGTVRWILRAEGACVLLTCLMAYARVGEGWGLFALLFLVPDIALLAYLGGPRLGSAAYNLAHSYVGALALLALGAAFANPPVLAGGLIWAAHIGFDRMLGYGLKYAEGFVHTHLGIIGRARPGPSP